MDEAIITTSWDDGHPLDLKLAELLQKYEIPATFYIPVINIEREYMSAQEIQEIAKSFDVGAHTYHHVNLTRIPHQEAETEVADGKKKLEQMIGREISSFCYPYGSFNNDVIDIVKRVGFIGGRMTKLFIRNLKDPLKMGTTVYAKDLRSVAYAKHAIFSLDPNLFFFILKRNLLKKGWEQQAIETLDFVVENGGVWHLWGHSWEIDGNRDWEKLEAVLRQINTLPKKVLRVNNSQLSRISPAKDKTIA